MNPHNVLKNHDKNSTNMLAVLLIILIIIATLSGVSNILLQLKNKNESKTLNSTLSPTSHFNTTFTNSTTSLFDDDQNSTDFPTIVDDNSTYYD